MNEMSDNGKCGEWEDLTISGQDNVAIGALNRSLETVDQHNKRIIEERTKPVKPENPTGVACPMCGNELSWWATENDLLVIGPDSYGRQGDIELWYLPAVCNRCGHRMNLLIE